MHLKAAAALAFCVTIVSARVSLTPPPESAVDSTTAAPSSSSSTPSTNSNASVTPTSSAQFPTLSGYSQCVTNCLQLAVGVNCTSVVEVNCYCNTPRFTRDLFNCTSVSCPQELETSENLAQKFCNIANSSTSLSFPSTTSRPTSASSSSLSTSVPTTPSGTIPSTTSLTSAGNAATSNAAISGLQLLRGNGADSSPFIALGLAFLGAVIGTTIIQ